MPEQTAQVFDLVVVGGGPGGYPAAIRAAERGLKTALVDNVRLDWSGVGKRRERVTRTLTDGVAGLLRANGVTVVNGHARFVGPTAVEVVAVGEAPAPPPPAGRARAGKLATEDLTGGTFTVSNLGMYGTDRFTAPSRRSQRQWNSTGTRPPSTTTSTCTCGRRRLCGRQDLLLSTTRPRTPAHVGRGTDACDPMEGHSDG
jgi:hypothetical protein